MARKFSFTPGEFYHIYNRGVDKRIVFDSDRDKERFQALLYLANGSKNFELSEIERSDVLTIDRGSELCAIGAYCLMDNHFHILVKEIVEGGISKFMQKLSTAYTMYYNACHERTGSLFGGRFKAVHVRSNNHLRYLRQYIHLNPVSIVEPKWRERGIKDLGSVKKYVASYQFSSFVDHVGQTRPETVIMKLNEFPQYEDNLAEVEESTFYWLENEIDV